ncbi:hypothetical protein SLE2022_367410 [Rubroshorea leprosula]
MEPDISELDSDDLLRQASRLLSSRDFSTSRKYAIMARRFYPNLAELNEILAIAEVIISAENRRLPSDHLAYYSILQVPDSQVDNRKLIQNQFMKLALILNPSTNKFPFALEALNHVRNAWSVLSNPKRKTQYDIENSSGKMPQGKEHKEEDICQQNRTQNCNGPSNGKGFKRDRKIESGSQEQGGRGHRENVRGKATFWTVCPYCFHLYEYEKVYEECCLLCQECRKGFHGMAVPPPPSSMLDEGNGYYSGYGVFPLGYPVGDFLGNKKEDGGGDNVKVDNFVVISDDSDDDLDTNLKTEGYQVKEEVSTVGEPVVKDDGMDMSAKNDDFQVKEGVSGVGNSGEGMQSRVMRRKSVARNTKKMMGRGIKKKKIEDIKVPEMNTGVENGSGDGCYEDDLEFFEGDEDIYVCIRDSD